MLEKAIISGVVHTREETVYRVAGIGSRAAVRRARGGGRERRHDRPGQRGRDRLLRAERGQADAERTLDSLGVEWSPRDDLGKVSVVGAGMKSHPGVAAKTFATLHEQGVEPAVVTDFRRSRSRATCRRDDVERAVRALHEAFDLA